MVKRPHRPRGLSEYSYYELSVSCFPASISCGQLIEFGCGGVCGSQQGCERLAALGSDSAVMAFLDFL